MTAPQRWARLDVGYFRNPKIVPLSSASRLLHIASILYCAEELTDASIEPAATRLLAGSVPVEPRYLGPAISQLEASGLWVPTADGWHLNGFEERNAQAMRAVVERERKLAAARQQRYRARRSR